MLRKEDLSSMQYRTLGRTGLVVSELALGTVALGTDYGIQVPAARGLTRPDASRLIHQAVDAGISLFDTAPTYGDSERLLVEALKSHPQCYVATKVSLPTDTDGKLLSGKTLQRAVQTSVENSLRTLQRDVLDIVQIHNATAEAIAQGEIIKVLLDAKQRGKVRFLGASVYGEDDAVGMIESGHFDVLQVAYNLLDQRMAQRVFPAAEQAGVGIVVRSALLKGVLTDRARWLSPELSDLRQAAERVREILNGSWQSLTQVAVRFCLSAPHVGTVLVGAQTEKELKQSLAAEKAGPLSETLLARTLGLALKDERYLNPSHWLNV